MELAVHELKAGLSRYLQQARDGGHLVITSHGQPVARISGVPAQATGGLDALIASGAAQWSGRKPELLPPLALPPAAAAPASVSELVLEDRG